jgi:hypothetical protein
MIGFISTYFTLSLLVTFKYRPYSAIVHLHTFQFTVSHVLGFSVSTSRFLATDLTQELSLQILHTNEVFKSHDKIFFNYETSAVVSRRELIVNYSVSPTNPLIGHAKTNSDSVALSRVPYVYSCRLATRGASRLGKEKTSLLLLRNIPLFEVSVSQ